MRILRENGKKWSATMLCAQAKTMRCHSKLNTQFMLKRSTDNIEVCFTNCLAALILTRPSSVVSFFCGGIASSNAINVRQIGRFDWRITFTSSFDIVSRFFSKNPFDWYWTVSEKCLIMKAETKKTATIQFYSLFDWTFV